MINNISDYNCKVIYKGLSYFSSGSPLVSEFSNNVPRIISIKEKEKLPVELMDIYKKVLTDESITLYKGKLKFNLNEGGIPEFTENFNNKVSVNLSTGEVEKDFEFKNSFVYTLTDSRSLEDIMLFLIKVASIKNEYVFSELARDSSFLTKSGYYNKGIVMSNVFHLITDNIEGFETAFASESDLQSLEAGKTVHNGTYLDFLNSVDQYIDTHPRDPNYDSRRDTVFDWISNLKEKRRIN